MKANKIILIIIGFVVVVSIAALYPTLSETESINLDMSRSSGTVNTSMGSPVLGSPDAPITIIEFGDYQCPNCKKWFLDSKPKIVSNLIDTGKTNLIFVDIAFLGKDSLPAASATYCAEEQGEYWDYHGLLYSNQLGIDTGWANSERLKAFAFDLGLDMDLFASCLDSGKYDKRVQFNTSVASKNGVNSTPTFIIVGPDGEQIMIRGPQPYSVFEETVESLI